jgi:hypothetical protein
MPFCNCDSCPSKGNPGNFQLFDLWFQSYQKAVRFFLPYCAASAQSCAISPVINGLSQAFGFLHIIVATNFNTCVMAVFTTSGYLVFAAATSNTVAAMLADSGYNFANDSQCLSTSFIFIKCWDTDPRQPVPRLLFLIQKVHDSHVH